MHTHTPYITVGDCSPSHTSSNDRSKARENSREAVKVVHTAGVLQIQPAVHDRLCVCACVCVREWVSRAHAGDRAAHIVTPEKLVLG